MKIEILSNQPKFVEIYPLHQALETSNLATPYATTVLAVDQDDMLDKVELARNTSEPLMLEYMDFLSGHRREVNVAAAKKGPDNTVILVVYDI